MSERDDLTRLVERATSSFLLGPDLALNVEILDRVSVSEGALCRVLDAVADQIDSEEPATVQLAIELLDMVMKNVPAAYSIVGSRDYLEVLYELAHSDTPALARAREAALDFVQFYGTKFSRDRSTHFAWLLNELRKEGVKFPPPRSDPWQPEGVEPLEVLHEANSVAALSRAPLSAHNLYHKIQQLRNTQSLFDEQLATRTRSALLDEELAPQCRALHAQFVDFLSYDVESAALQDKVRAELMQLTDALAHSLRRYDALVKQTLPEHARTPQENAHSSSAENKAREGGEDEDDPFTTLASRPRPALAPSPPSDSLI